MTQPDPNARWEAVVPDGWAETVIGWDWHDWREQDTKLGWRKWGPCPRCGHTMVVYQRVLRSPVRSLNARCNCTYEHEDRPEVERGGCGPGSGATKVAIPSAGSG
jgi:hypothetical protein